MAATAWPRLRCRAMTMAAMPWLPRALQALELRAGARLLMALPAAAETARAAAAALGKTGRLTVLDPRRTLCEAIAKALPLCEAVVGEPEPTHKLGTFDAVLVAPLRCRPREAEAWAAFLKRNLRPGGRFALDLAAPAMFPEVLAAAESEGLACAAALRAAFVGPSAAELLAAVRAAGLRQTEQLLEAHLVGFTSPFEAAAQIGAAADLREDDREGLGEAIARLCRSTAEVELRVLRAGCAGMR